MADVTVFLSFIAGLLSFLSPCILPIIPGFMAYLTGTSETYKPTRKDTFLNSLFFVLGFSIVFAALGVLLNTTLSNISYNVQVWLSRIGGTIIIILALHIIGLIQIPFLMMEHKLEVKRMRSQYLTSLAFGGAFAVGWSPCVGAILGIVLALAVTQPGISFFLLLAYAIGLGLPFLAVGLFTNEAYGLLKRWKGFLRYFNVVVGILMLLIGVLVFTNNLTLVSSFIIPQGVIGK